MQNNISIVIPTLHRKNSLIRLLENLSHMEFSGEIIIVEQVENNATELIQLSKKLALRLSYIFMKKPSTARAMNLGTNKATGEYVLFLDDDILGSKGFVQHHAENFNNPNVAATVGRCITVGQKVEAEYTKTGRISWLGTISDGFSSTFRQKVDTVIGCNTCWRKDVYMKLGGMDEQFTGNALRLESDLSIRARNLGYNIVFDPQAEITHLREESGGARKTEGRIQWYVDFFSNETYFFLKHFYKILFPLFLATKIQWALRCMFGFGREVSVRSFITPYTGVIDGLQKYYNYYHDNRR